MHLFLAPCPCAVTANPKLKGNVVYNGKCYLLYEAWTQLDHNEAQARCQNPTSPPCGVSGSACTTSGVGRLATFPSYADYANAVTTQLMYSSSNCVHLGVLCSPSDQMTIDNAGNSCGATPKLNPPWPNSSNCPGQVFADNNWWQFDASTPQGCDQYICEVGKNLNMVKKTILLARPGCLLLLAFALQSITVITQLKPNLAISVNRCRFASLCRPPVGLTV